MKYLRRFIWYLAGRLLLICLILGLAVITFYYAMNLTNIQIVLKDGMAKRAQTVMGMENSAELGKYFSASFLERDTALQTVTQGNSPYQYYNVRGIDHRLELSFFWIWPWEDTARVDVTERIPRIDGRAKGAYAEQLTAAGGSEALYPPKWQAGRYRAVLKKENDAWNIASLTLLEIPEN